MLISFSDALSPPPAPNLAVKLKYTRQKCHFQLPQHQEHATYSFIL